MSTPARLLPLAALIGAAALSVAGCGAGTQAETSREHTVSDGFSQQFGTLAISGGYVAGPATGTAYAYAVLSNSDGADDTLTDVSSPVASAVSLRRLDAGTAGATATPLTIPHRGQVRLAPGTYAIVLSGLSSPLRLGTSLQITLTFATSGEHTMLWPVSKVGAASNAGAPGLAPSDTPAATPPAAPTAAPAGSPAPTTTTPTASAGASASAGANPYTSG